MANADNSNQQSECDESGTCPGEDAFAPKPTAAEAFLHLLTSEVNREDVYKMVNSQQHMLLRFEKTNEMLLNFNALSLSRYESTCRDFKRHTQLLLDMKRDLDSVFKRIRVIKTKLSQQHPEAFKVCGDVYTMLEVEEMQEASAVTTPVAAHSTADVHSDAAMTHLGAAVTHLGAAVTHPDAAVTHPGATVTHLGVVEMPAIPQLVNPSEKAHCNGADTEKQGSESVRPKEQQSNTICEIDKRAEFRKAWSGAKTKTSRTPPGVATVVEGEDDDDTD